jgi:outer membrane protein OmpA-like peptidoglycan-associated protein
MKKLLFFMIVTGSAAPVFAQGPNYLTDDLLSRWAIDLNLLGGGASQMFTSPNTNANYPNGLNFNTGQLTYNNGYSFGGDGQIGFFFGKKRHFGLGAGFMYMQQAGFANLNNYHVEYQATDGAGNIFRQVVTGDNVSEHITSTNMNIPLVLKYKNRFSKHWGFAADAGALVNIQMKNAYTTNASFDYEAIYKFDQSAEGTTSVYDNSPVPSANDWMITKAEFLKNNPDGNLQQYFAAKRALGYSVGDGLAPATRSGNVSYTQGSVGFLLQPSMNYFLSDHVALNLGLYYMFQPFKNSAQNDYRLTEGIGSYSTVLNNVSSSINQSYGLNIGVRFFLGKKRAPLNIASVDLNPPTQCGMCDGSIALNGLTPNQQVTVDYSLNGAPQTRFSGTVQPDGKVKISNLCAGSYTGIKAAIKRKSAIRDTVTLIDPVMSISSQNIVNPTIAASFDGSATFNGLYAGSRVSVAYKINGSSLAPSTYMVNPDRSVTINSLGEGKYTDIVITSKTCSANGADFTLMAPVPPPPPPVAPAPVVEQEENSSPILFEFNRSDVRGTYYPELEEAAKEMKKDVRKTITIDGYTDNKGTDKYNEALSRKRADEVKRHLAHMGISGRRVKTAGHGFNSPVGDNSTPEGREKNRRAELKMKDGGK